MKLKSEIITRWTVTSPREKRREVLEWLLEKKFTIVDSVLHSEQDIWVAEKVTASIETDYRGLDG